MCAVYALSGTGEQDLTSGTTSLYVTVSSVSVKATHGRAFPPNWYDIGLLRFGKDDFYLPTFPIDAESMLVFVPDGVTQLGYSIFGGLTISVSEDSPPAGSGWTLLASNSAYGAFGVAPIDITGADLLIVGATWYGTGGGGTCSDSLGNIWTPLTAQIPSGVTYTTQLYWSVPTIFGSDSFYTCCANGTTSVLAFSTTGTPAFDVEGGSQGDGAINEVIPTGTITTANAGELIIAGFGISDPVDAGTPLFVVDSGMTIAEAADVVPGSSFGLVLAYAIQSAAGSFSANLTRSNSSTTQSDASTIAAFSN